jgi:KDO2-lipid IV(A) lauroyltransferase
MLITYFLVRALVGLFAFIPFWALYFISDTLAVLLEYVLRYRRRVITLNLRSAFPEKTEAERHRIRHYFYQHLSDILLESIKGYSMSPGALARRFTLDNVDLLEHYHKQGKSVIFLGGHICNWEWGALAFSDAFPQPCVTVFKPISNPYINQFIQKKRAAHGARVVEMKRLGRALVNARKEDVAFLLLGDQGPSDMANAIWTHFLNRETPFLQGPEKIARSTGFPVIYGRPRKEGRGRYALTFVELSPDSKDSQAGEVTAALAKALEEDIHAMPPLWLWSHRRWKRAGGP